MKKFFENLKGEFEYLGFCFWLMFNTSEHKKGGNK